MALNLKHSLLAASLALITAGLCSAPAALAAEKKVAPKKADSKKAASKKHAKAEPKVEEDSGPSEADEGDTVTTDYRCELGNTLTIFQHDGDDSHIALRWKKRIHRLDKVGTTTGAQRYQNTTFGLIWIGIPSKGMLLDAKLNRQLANECRNAEQERGELAIKPVIKSNDMPSTKVVEKVEPIVPVDKQPLPLPLPAAAPAAPATTPSTTPATMPSTVPATTPAVAPVPPVATPAAPVSVPTTPAPMAAPGAIVTPVAAPADVVPGAAPASAPATMPAPTPTLPATDNPAAPAVPPAADGKPATN